MRHESKITALLEGLELAQTLKINSSDELRERLSEVGKTLGKLRAEIAATKSKGADIQKELSSIDPFADDTARVNGLMKEYHEISASYVEIRKEIASLSEEYRLLSKLDGIIKMSKSPKFCLGRESDLSDYPLQIVNEKTKGSVSDHDLSVTRDDRSRSQRARELSSETGLKH